MIVKAAVLCLFLGLFSFGLYDVLTNFETNNCEMTYMFETPEYLVSKETVRTFPARSLYVIKLNGFNAFRREKDDF